MHDYRIHRIILIVLDSVGVGYLPDAGLYGDEGADTLGHIYANTNLHLPALQSLGLGNIVGGKTFPSTDKPLAAFGKAAEKSAGKDTTTGHWEIAGCVLEKPFPTFPNGFPETFIKEFEQKIGLETIGNTVASGTEIIDRLGDKHVRTGKPIVYTSADSVFQIAMHEDVIPLETQYTICRTAREMLTGVLEVGRVIARPFRGSSGNYFRTSGRKDFALEPPVTVLDAITAQGGHVLGVGKIHDIFAGKGISESFKTGNNQEGMEITERLVSEGRGRLIFANLVDFDMHFGHRRDVLGYANCLTEFDAWLASFLPALKEDDLLIITADHGNDPTWKGTDHTREYIPVLHYGNKVKSGVNIGVRGSFADIAATMAQALGIKFESQGKSYLDMIL
jgi:phosphopentomutase